MSRYRYLTAGKMKVFSLGLLILSVLAVNAHAQSILGNASSFAVLGGTADVTNTGSTTLSGNLGVSPGTSITQAGTFTFTSGTIHDNDAVAAAAQGSLTTALTDLGALSSVATLIGANLTLDGPLAPGVYSVPAAISNLTGSLTLAGTSNANDTWVFLMPSTLITSTGSSVTVTGDGTNGGNVFWDVGSAATIQSGTKFYGNILAVANIAMVTGATDSCGSVLSQTAVTLDTNTISKGCNLGVTATTSGGVTTVIVPTGGSGGGTITGTVMVPEGGSTLLYLCSFLLPLGAMRVFRFRRSI